MPLQIEDLDLHLDIPIFVMLLRVFWSVRLGGNSPFPFQNRIPEKLKNQIVKYILSFK